MEHYGEKGGVFTADGRQVGAILRWKLATLESPMFEGDTSGLNRTIYKGWKGEARKYRFVKPVSDTDELEFRLICKGSWYVVKGRVIGEPGTEGEGLKMSGTDKPVSHKPGGK